MYETFDEVSDKQIFFKKIIVEISYPFSEVTFDKEDFIKATKIMIGKFIGGFNDCEEGDRIVYLNNEKIINSELYIWEDENKLFIFIEKNKIKIKDKNKYTIKIKNKDQYEYIRHIVTFEEYENVW